MYFKQLIGDSALKKILQFACLLIVSLGLILSLSGGYGSDNDTYGLLSSFISIYKYGNYTPSRFTGYPLAELIIGFAALLGGYKLSSSLTFSAFILSLPLIFYGFRAYTNRKQISNQFAWFFLFCCLNGILFFDNIQTMDYAWALLFLCAGIFCDSRRNNSYNDVLTYIFLACSIGCRPNFALFAIIVIVFGSNYDYSNDKSVDKFLKVISEVLLTLFIGSLFFLPIWFDHSFGFEWIGVAKEPFNLLKTPIIFAIKTSYSLGFLFAIFIFVRVTYNLIMGSRSGLKLCAQQLILADFRLPVFLGLGNLLMFLWAPIDYSYLQVFLVVFFYLLSSHANNLLKFQVIFFVLLEWFVIITPFNYRVISQFFLRFNQDCSSIKSEGAMRRFRIQIAPGKFIQYKASRFIGGNCWGKDEVNELNKIR